MAVTDPKADFFTHGGGSLTAAQLVARIRTRYPQVSVNDVYLHPRLRGAGGASWTTLGATSDAGAATSCRPRARAALAQALLMAPMLALVGLRWTSVAAAISTVAAVAVPWAPTVPWWSLAVAWLVLFSPAGRIGIAAGGARLLLRGVRPGSYPRGGSVHVRLWAATRLAELSGATGVSGASWTARYARALGAKIGKDVDLHSAPPVTGMLKIGRGAAVAAGGGPRRLLGRRRRRAHRQDPDRRRRHRRRAQHAAAGRPDRQGRRDRRGVDGARRRSRRSALGGLARAAGRQERACGGRRPGLRARAAGRSPTACTSVLLGLLPAVAALPALVVVGVGVAGTASPAAAMRWRAAHGRRPATLAYLAAYAALVVVGVRLLGIGMAEGFHPVHSRDRLAGLDHRAADGHGPHGAVPAVLQPVHGRVAAVARRAGRPRRGGVDGDRAAEDDHGRATARSSPTTPWSAPTSSPAAGCASAPSRIGKQAFLGNSGMTAPGRSVPNRGLVGVLSAAPRKAKKGSSWLGLPPMPLRRAVEYGDASRTFDPPRSAQGRPPADRAVQAGAGDVLRRARRARRRAAHGGPRRRRGSRWPRCSPARCCSRRGLTAAAVTTAAKWLLVGRFRPVEHPLWSSFVWRNELADTFVEVVAVPWLVGQASGTPVLTAWLRTMGASIGRGVWLETYWLPESDLVRLGDGATVNRGCVVQTHLFHDRIMRMDEVRIDEGATLGPNGIILPGAGDRRGDDRRAGLPGHARRRRARRRPAGWATRSRRGAEPQTDGGRGPVGRPVPARARQRRVPGRALRAGHRLQAGAQPARPGGPCSPPWPRRR